MGDEATFSDRSCGCPVEELGWRVHLHSIRSYEKLTGGGITFAICPEDTVILIIDAEDEDILRTDDLLRNVLIQRSRKYVKRSEGDEENAPLFPERQKLSDVKYKFSLTTIISTVIW